MSELNSDYLAHHGIKGQKWGERHGPPYPLDKKTHKSVVSGKAKLSKEEKRRQKILHNAKLLYKHADEFTKEEIDAAYEKLQSMNKVKRSYAVDTTKIKQSKAEKKQAAKEEKKIAKKVNKYARNVDQLSKNISKLTEKEIDYALDRLDRKKRISEHRFDQVKKPRLVIDEVVSYIKTMKNLFNTIYSPGPKALKDTEAHIDWLIKNKKFQHLTTDQQKQYKESLKMHKNKDYVELADLSNEDIKKIYNAGGQSIVDAISTPISIVSDKALDTIKSWIKDDDDRVQHSDIIGMDMDELKNYLAHHGIKGQKWGERHGPPYPLDSKEHNKVVKSANNSNKSASNKKSKDGIIILPDPVATLIANLALAAIPLAAIGLAEAKKKIDVAVDDKKDKKMKDLVDKKNSAEDVKIDEKTGLRLKAKEATIKEDLKAVNPYFSRMGKNTNNNCVYCSFAYEMRRRGFDTIAKLSPKGVYTSAYKKVFPTAEIKLLDPFGVFRDDLGSLNWQNVQRASYSFGRTIKMKKAFKQLASEEGSRGILSILWNEGRGGHCTTYFVENGKIKIADPQSGRILTFNDEYLNNTIGIMAMRTDNIKTEDINIEELKRYVQ